MKRTLTFITGKFRCWVFVSAIALMAQAITGCSRHDDWKVKTYPTSGTLTINGAPAQHVVIVLYPLTARIDKRDSKPCAIVDANGQFELSTYQPRDGVPPGEYAVTLYWPSNPTETSPDRLGGAYVDPKKPAMTVTIQKRKNTLPPIELMGVKVQPSRPPRS